MRDREYPDGHLDHRPRCGLGLLSGWFVLNGMMTIGGFVLYVTLQNMAYQPLTQLSAIIPRMRRNATRVERVFTILDEPIHLTDKPNATELSPLSREIDFKNV